MASEKDERLATEIALLESMYPDQINFNEKSEELSYTTSNASLQLRIPDGYLVDSLPEVLSGSIGKVDRRQAVKQAIASQAVGEEILDSIIMYFNDMVEQTTSEEAQNKESIQDPEETPRATMIIYLHHLLNTNKRKMCVSPPHSSISGVIKPGYPGVLIYSGPSHAVHEHVNVLKGLNWAAFQVRSEMEGEKWEFKHGKGVVEVESMGDVVAEVDVEEGRKETFMEAMRMK